MNKHTPAPWSVRTLVRNEKIVDCFVTANDVNGFAHKAEIMGDDEYRDGIERKLADATLISAAPELLEAAILGLSIAETEIDERYSGSLHKHMNERLNPIRAAIAKARGEA